MGGGGGQKSPKNHPHGLWMFPNEKQNYIWRSVVEYALVRVMNVELFFDLCCMYVSLFKNQRNYYVNNQKKKKKFTRYSENLIFLCRLSNGKKIIIILSSTTYLVLIIFRVYIASGNQEKIYKKEEENYLLCILYRMNVYNVVSF